MTDKKNLARLLDGVPRLELEQPESHMGSAYMRADPDGYYVRYADILAALSAAHVNETPKSEHDAGDVLTALPADVAGVVAEAEKVLEGVTPGPWEFFKTGNKEAVFGVTPKLGGDICQMSNAKAWRGKETIQNARFIAWCREGVPALIALATARAAQIAGLEEERDRYLRHLTAGAKALNEYKSRAEAAEAKVAELEAQIAGHQDEVDALNDTITMNNGTARTLEARVEAAETALAAERAKVAKLVEALEFYADDFSWRRNGPLDGNSPNFTGGPARAAITEAGQ